jgi:hypothetical protein
MTSNLRLLIWAAVLIGWGALLLDWRDELVKLRPERVRLEQLRAKEQSTLWNVDWKASVQDAKLAQSQWLERLPKVEQTGVFRAQALEAIADLCRQIDAACQVSAMGERVSSPNLGKSNAEGLSGVIATGVKVSLPLQDKKLELFMQSLENDTTLRRIDKLFAQSGRITLEVQSFGLDSRALAAPATGSSGPRAVLP